MGEPLKRIRDLGGICGSGLRQPRHDAGGAAAGLGFGEGRLMLHIRRVGAAEILLEEKARGVGHVSARQ